MAGRFLLCKPEQQGGAEVEAEALVMTMQTPLKQNESFGYIRTVELHEGQPLLQRDGLHDDGLSEGPETTCRARLKGA